MLLFLLASLLTLWHAAAIEATTLRTDLYDNNNRVVEQRYTDDKNTSAKNDDVILYSFKFYYKNEKTAEIKNATKVQNGRVNSEYYYQNGTSFGNHSSKIIYRYDYFYNANGTLGSAMKVENGKTAIQYYYASGTRYGNHGNKVSFQYRFYYNKDNTISYATKVQNGRIMMYYYYQKGTKFGGHGNKIRHKYDGKKISSHGINYSLKNNSLIHDSKLAKYNIYYDLSKVSNNNTKQHIKNAINDFNKHRGANGNNGIYISYVNSPNKNKTITVYSYNKVTSNHCSSNDAVGCATWPGDYRNTLVIQNNLNKDTTMQVFGHEVLHNLGVDHITQNYCGSSVMVPYTYSKCVNKNYSISGYKADLNLWKEINK